ncbi:MAG: GNAT family N-acetyltransferase [Rhizobiales bacterium]|nr:GNAT family N-acetyltransferase [Hyphomicrobiales bacterium]
MTAVSVTIRDYEERDQAGVIALARQLQAHELQYYERMKPVDAMDGSYVAHLIAEVSEHNGRFLVADDGTRLVGYCTLLTDRDSSDQFDEVLYRYAYVGDLVVATEARGKGVGALLIAQCEATARASGRAWLRLSVMAANSGARRFYSANGFEENLILLEKKL